MSVLIQQARQWRADSAGHMAAAHASTGLLVGSGKATPGAGVSDAVPRRQCSADVVFVGEPLAAQVGADLVDRRLGPGRRVRYAVTRCTPSRQATVKHQHVFVAEQAEGPPAARCAEHVLLVVDHHCVVGGNPHGAHCDGKDFRRRRRVGQVGRCADSVDVEELRTRNMLLLKQGAGVLFLVGQVEGCVDQSDRRPGLQARVEISGGNQGRAVVRHGLVFLSAGDQSSSQGGTGRPLDFRKSGLYIFEA